MDSDEEDSAEEDDEVPENPPENSLDVLDPASSATLTPGDHLAVHGSGFKVVNKSKEKSIQSKITIIFFSFVKARVLEGLLKSDFVAKVAESEWVKKNITGKQITLQLQLHSIKGTLTVNMPPAPSDRIW